MQKRTKIGHFLKQCDIIRLNIKERLDIYQEINTMTGFTVGGKLVETPGLTTEQIAQIEKEQKQEQQLLTEVTEETFSPIERSQRINNPECYKENGTIKKGSRFKHPSNRQLRLRNRRRKVYRSLSEERTKFQG